jgi:hypothetical protein
MAWLGYDDRKYSPRLNQPILPSSGGVQHQISSGGDGDGGGGAVGDSCCYCYRITESNGRLPGHRTACFWATIGTLVGKGIRYKAHLALSLYTPFNAWAGGLFGCPFIFSDQRQQHLTTAGTEVSARSKAVGVGGEPSFASTKLSPLLPR